MATGKDSDEFLGTTDGDTAGGSRTPGGGGVLFNPLEPDGVSVADEPLFDAEAVDVVRFNVPPYTGKLRSWFTRLEAQFRAGKLRSAQVKFNVVIAQAPEHIIDQLGEDEIEALSKSRDCYEALKGLLLRRFSPTEDERFAKLFSEMNLPTNERPSDIYRRIQVEAKGLLPNETVKRMWLMKLPNIIQMLLLPDNNLPMLELTERADEYFRRSKGAEVDAIQQWPSNNPFAHPAPLTPLNSASTHPQVAFPPAQVVQPTPDPLAVIAKTLEKLSAEVAALKVSHNSRNSSRSASRSRNNQPRARGPTPIPQRPLCWYHHKFGDRATRCVQPCSFVQSGN